MEIGDRRGDRAAWKNSLRLFQNKLPEKISALGIYLGIAFYTVLVDFVNQFPSDNYLCLSNIIIFIQYIPGSAIFLREGKGSRTQTR